MRPIVTPYLKNYWLVPIFCLGFWNLILAQEQDSVVDTMVWDEHTTYDRGNFRDSTYSNAAAGKANVSMRQVNYTEQFLQGSVAGLVAIENSGQPGGSMSLQIRGAHTIGAGSQPLYIIDGIPIYQSVRPSSFATTFGPALGALSFLNPNDIASITVLKDAAATALYGARGSNGVIIIRTKRAEKSQSGIELKISGGLQQPIGEYKLANARQYASFLNEAQLNAGLPALYSNPDVFGAGTDWQEAIRREQAWSQHYHLGITGGGDKVSFLLSGQYLNQNGLAIGSDLQRYSIHANIDAQVNDRFTVQNSFNFARVESNTIPSASSADNQSQDVISGSMLFNPLLPLVNPDQSVNNHNVKVAEDGKPLSLLQSHFAQANPRLLGGITDSKLSFNQLSNYVSLNYAATEKLSMQTTIGLNAIFNDQFTFVPGQLFFGSAADAIGTAAKTQSLQFINEYKIAYTHNFVAQHQVIARVGFSTEGYRQEFLAGQSVGFDNESLRFYSLTVGQDKNLQSDLSEWGMQSYLGTIDYKYANRYALTLSLRSDASSFFSGAHSVFPAVSTHWDLSTTSFVKNSHFINKLAFRASYGETGNQSIAPYSSYTVLNEFNPALNGGTINGISLSRIGNNALDAERTNQLNGGLHLGFCNNRFLLDFDVYHHKTDNALVWQPLAGSSGFEDVLTNAANITNTGVELSLSANASANELKWSGQFTLGHNKNELKSLADMEQIIIGDQLLGMSGWSLLQAGSPVGSFYGYRTDGLVREGENPATFAGQVLSPGDQKYQDINGDGVINSADKTIIGKSQPSLSLGLYNTFNYKGFDLRIFIQGLLGHDMANFNRLLLENPTGLSNVSEDYLNQAGQDLPVPRSAPNSQFVFSDRIVEDGSYLRLKNVTIGYSLPKINALNNAISSLRLYVSAENLLTITGYSGLDPDVSHFGSLPDAHGVDLGIYPKAKFFMAGININF